jgi:alpha-L-arabinofuranosidase
MYGSCIEDVNHEIYGGLYDQKIFGESFEEPSAPDKIAGWTSYGGKWRGDGATCGVDSDAGAKLVRDAPVLKDGTIETDLFFSNTKGENAGVLVRVQNPAVGADNFSGYEVSLSPSRQKLILGKHQHDWHPIQEANIEIKAQQWIHLKVELTGAHIVIYVNHSTAPSIDFTDSDNPILFGQFALRTWNSDVLFRNAQIVTNEGPVDCGFGSTKSLSVSGKWDPLITGSAVADFKLDENRPFNGMRSQMIRRGQGSGQVGVSNRGLNRWGIAVKKGQVFEGRVYLRANALQGPVTVALQSADGKATYAVKTFSGIGVDWNKYPFILKSNADDPNAKFAIWIDRPGTLWVDQAVLMEDANTRYHGLPIRADIAGMLVDGGVNFLRYGGTMVNAPEYRWKKMIGDPDKRPPYNGHWYSSSTNGFGIFDFLNFCEAAHIESAFAINAEETDQDAADLADYLTGSTATIWGRKRADDGHPAPYNVRYIEIGNEEVIWGDNPADYAHYADRFKAIAQAIHGRNPKLQLVCAAWWVPQSSSMKPVFDAVNGQAAAWDLHVWSDDARAGEGIDRQITQMQTLFKQWDPKTSLKAVIFEENGNLHNMQRALGHATTLNATLRHGDFILADCAANCLQPWLQNDNGWDQGQVFFTPTAIWGMPPYYAQQMASSVSLPLYVESSVESPGNDLNVSTTRSENGDALVLMVANCGSAGHTAQIDLRGFTPQTPVRILTLSGEPNSANLPESPKLISPKQSEQKTISSPFVQFFPAYSYTVVKMIRKN